MIHILDASAILRFTRKSDFERVSRVRYLLYTAK